MKNIWKPILNLLIVAAVSVGLLFGMNAVTSSQIEKQEAQAVRRDFAGIIDAEEFEAMKSDSADGIESAWRALDKDGKLVGYAVTAKGKGYGGDMTVHVGVSPDGARFLGLRVGDNKESEGYGSRVTEAVFYNQFNSLTAPAMVGGYTGIEGTGDNSGSSAPSTPSGGWKDGTYTAMRSDYDSAGYRAFVELTVKDGKITAVNWDAYKAVTKKEESKAGDYVMTENGPKWHEQAQTMEKALIKAQDPGKLVYSKDDGKTDAYAGVSVSVSEFVTLSAQALDKARNGGTAWKDGTWRADQAEFSQGYKYFVELTIKNGKITAVNWDANKEKGAVTKKQQSRAGDYVMTDNGPKWHEQAQTMEKALIETQDPGKLAYDRDTGKTDAYAGVSIAVNEIAELSAEALKQATGEKVAQTVVNTGEGSGAIDAVSGATISSKAVVRAANTAWMFVKNTLEGNG